MTNFLVLDASFTLRFILFNEKSTTGHGLVNDWKQAGYTLCTPTLWACEITSALNKAVYFEQLTESEARRLLILAQNLGIQLIPPTNEQMLSAFDWTRRLQRATAYDSFYLALAQNLGCELWTADQRFVNNVNVDWVKLVS